MILNFVGRRATVSPQKLLKIISSPPFCLETPPYNFTVKTLFLDFMVHKRCYTVVWKHTVCKTSLIETTFRSNIMVVHRVLIQMLASYFL